MCGILGFWNQQQSLSKDALRAVVLKMSATLYHRGPDDGGEWSSSPEIGLGLGHRRLSILDLSRQGHQPMFSKNNRYVLVFNGEIYNFQQLRLQLRQLGHLFQGDSDTEVMLAAFCEWGVQNAVQQFNGMFAFALWDQQERTLSLGRDRIGEKPLYYGRLAQTFVFSSEIKALKQHPDWKGDINRDALALYFRHNCIPCPYSIYQGIYKLPPGTILTLRPNQLENIPQPVAYWSLETVAESGVVKPSSYSETEAISRLDTLLRDSVRTQMIADVPLGAFLSGGVDSSLIVAMMQTQSNQSVKTFSIGFQDHGYNEAPYAKAVAQHIGTDHTELYVTSQQALNVIPKLPDLYDEPFSDSSQIPTFLVAQLAKKYVTVCLSGDGGDELFGGYNRYFVGRSIWQKIGWLPPIIRRKVSESLISFSPATWNTLFSSFDRVLPSNLRPVLPGEKLHKLSEVFASPDPDSMYLGLVSHWKQPTELVLGSSELNTLLQDRALCKVLPDFTQRMMYRDLMTYLPDDILVKVDRAGMGVSLENRIPFLDHRVIEFAWQLPLSMKIRQGQGKWILRQILNQYLPQELIQRPKMGFGIPLDHWLRDSLKDWAEDLLDEHRLAREGFLNPLLIREKWAEHLSGRRNWQHLIWDVLMFQAWLSQS